MQNAKNVDEVDDGARGFDAVHDFLVYLANGFDGLIGNDRAQVKRWARAERRAVSRKFFAPLLEGRVYIRTYLLAPSSGPGGTFVPLDVHIQDKDGCFYQAWIDSLERKPKSWPKTVRGKAGLAAVHSCPTGRIHRDIVWSLRPCRGELIPARRLPAHMAKLAGLTGKARTAMRRDYETQMAKACYFWNTTHIPVSLAILQSRRKSLVARLSDYLLKSEVVPIDWNAASEFMQNYLGDHAREIRHGG